MAAPDPDVALRESAAVRAGVTVIGQDLRRDRRSRTRTVRREPARDAIGLQFLPASPL